MQKNKGTGEQMKKFQIKKIRFQKVELTKEGKQAAAGIGVGIVVLALLAFFLLFKVERIEIVGSTKYTDQEIKEYALSSPLTSNTVFAMMFKKHMEAENIPFVESFDLERLDMHTLRVHVNEKKIIGYVIEGTDKLYFDKDGKIVEKEAMEEEEITKMESALTELESLKEEAEREAALEAVREVEKELMGETEKEEEEPAQPEDIQTIQPEEVEAGNESATEFHAAVTDVPRVVGIPMKNVKLGKKISVPDKSVFNTILGITRMVEKYQILPEIVSFDEKLNITLVYFDGAVHCQLGKDSLLEEKITRVAAILPKLESETGILHLEDYTVETTNIIFSKESLYSLKKTIAQTEGLTEEEKPEQETSTESGTEGENPTMEPGTEGENPTAEPGTEGENPTAEPGTEGENPTAEPGTEGENSTAEPGTGEENTTSGTGTGQNSVNNGKATGEVNTSGAADSSEKSAETGLTENLLERKKETSTQNQP